MECGGSAPALHSMQAVGYNPGMSAWPHSPIHRLSEAGTFMVTAGTYLKSPLFGARDRLDLLCTTLFELAQTYGWQLQAWAIFPNHYHFVAISPPAAESLRRFVQHLHSVTAKRINLADGAAGRKVWFEYWETRLTYEKSYLARLSYVHSNAVHHGVVREATQYPWCGLTVRASKCQMNSLSRRLRQHRGAELRERQGGSRAPALQVSGGRCVRSRTWRVPFLRARRRRWSGCPGCAA